MIDVKKTSLLKYAVCAPIGGFGNHVRWLALLDPVFQFEITPLAEPRFKKMPDVSRHIRFLDAESKLHSFQTQIYSPRRSWDNWLWMEFLYREDLDKVLTFDHRGVGIEPVDKTLALVIDPAVALSGYFKLNSNLNHCTPEVFKDLAARANRNTISQANDSTKVLSADCLYQPTLDPQFYHDMIQWFGLSDCYELANHVHALWFQAHERAQQEFVSYTNNLYRKDQL